MTWLALVLAPQQITLTPGITLSHSGAIRAEQRLTAKEGIVIKGDDLTIDFQRAQLRSGTNSETEREKQDGTGILIEGCHNVTIKNARVQGYRFNVRVVDSTGVKLENCDVSFSRAILMMKDGATIDTFLDLRNSNAWRGYGAGIWIEKSMDCEVNQCRASGGTIGCALVDTTKTTVSHSDFSFCGGWGIGMARSSDNVISWNLLDFDNRSWGGGWGADAAAMGVADDCDHNYVVGNSMTHGGDGFFLSNSNDVGPVDPATGYLTPKGGSDHNVIAFNDGSWSPANAFEGTFSVGNVYYRNIASNSGYGFWLGFSNESLLIENLISNNRVSGIAIEHGRGTKIEGNQFLKNAESAIHLWASSGKERTPFPSTGIDILGNSISDSRTAYQMEGSSDFAIRGNKVERAEVKGFPDPDRPSVSGVEVFKKSPEWARLQEILKTRPKNFKMYPAMGLPKGIEWIQPDRYGPRQFKGDLAVWRQVDPTTVEIFVRQPSYWVMAPQVVTSVERIEPNVLRVSSAFGVFGEERKIEIQVLPYPPSFADHPTADEIVSSMRGAQRIDVTLRTISWNQKWFSWAGMTYDDRSAWTELFASPPLKSATVRQIDGDWTGRSPGEGIPAGHFAMLATAKFKFEAGKYAFNSVSDDGFRLLIDGKPVIDRWNHHGPTPDRAEVTLTQGVHDLRVEYCQEDGAAVLRLDWQKLK